MLRKLMMVAFILQLSACSHPPTEPSKEPSKESTTQQSEIVKCPEERAQICTREYRPVCATRDKGIRCITAPCPSSEEKTYGNACTACADAKVIEYRTGACEQVNDKK